MYSPINTNVIVNRKNVTGFISLAGAGIDTISNIINLIFIPDVVNIKLIQYTTPAGPENAIRLLYFDMVNDYIGPFYQNVIPNNNVTFILQKPINGNYNFYIRDINGITDATAAGQLVIQLEFVEYEKININSIKNVYVAKNK
jgi:hypothetical protein